MISLAIDGNLLVAYVDGELDRELGRQVRAQIENDPVLTERVAMFGRADALLKAAMSEAFFRDICPRSKCKRDRPELERRNPVPCPSGLFGVTRGEPISRGEMRRQMLMPRYY